ncbi:MAG: lipopolysaccharide heptosyltransferase family protein [Ignavibacteriae bacterium]|nr:MAG: lipopolysaccharide heptosyltransferase family protein [Ignavibacteriota bacterium]
MINKKKIYKIIYSIGSLIFFFRKKNIDINKVKNILVISLYFRGDTLFHTPSIRVLKEIFPDSSIDVWVKSRSKDVLSGNPYINEIIVFDEIRTSDYNEKSKLSLRNKIKFLKFIRNKKYDFVVDLTGKYSTALFTALSKSKYSIGINYNGFGFCYSKFVPLDTSHSPGHLIDKYLSVIEKGLGYRGEEWNRIINKNGNSQEIFIDKEIENNINEKIKILMLSGRPLITIHTTSGWDAKKWDYKKFAELIRLLKSEYNYNTLMIGDRTDLENIKNILNEIKDLEEENIPLYIITSSLVETAALIRRSDVFIGSDSVPLHIAGAVDTPSIALFGPTNPEFSKPRGEKHIVIYKILSCSADENVQFCTRDAGKTCLTIDCMKMITAKEISEKVIFLLNKYYYNPAQ